MQAWHFLSEDKRLGFDDGRLVEVGVPLECEGILELCSNGMHGSVRLIDALCYADGPIVCRVEIEGHVIEGDDKLCGRRRTVLWWLDATRILHEFACECAEGALALIDNPDPRSVAAVAAKRRWLNGEIADEELAAAWSAARSAAWDAAATAAADGARAAAWAAVRTTAWSVAHGAAYAAAEASDYAATTIAAAAAARAATIAKQNARLTEMVMEAHEREV
jgi:hypothetical protein